MKKIKLIIALLMLNTLAAQNVSYLKTAKYSPNTHDSYFAWEKDEERENAFFFEAPMTSYGFDEIFVEIDKVTDYYGFTKEDMVSNNSVFYSKEYLGKTNEQLRGEIMRGVSEIMVSYTKKINNEYLVFVINLSRGGNLLMLTQEK